MKTKKHLQGVDNVLCLCRLRLRPEPNNARIKGLPGRPTIERESTGTLGYGGIVGSLGKAKVGGQCHTMLTLLKGKLAGQDLKHNACG
jgi:hypothetical protein